MPDITAQTPDGVTHSFPDGTPDEVIDKVIKQHMATFIPNEAQAAAHPPTDPNAAALVNKVGGQIREKGRIQKIGAPSELTGTSASPSEDASTAGITSTALGAVASPLRTVQGAIGSAAGAYGGGKTGRYLGGDTGETIGKVGGGLLGGVAGYSAEIPGEYNIGGVNLKNPWASPYITADPTGELGVKAHAEMEQDIAQQHQNRVAANDEMNQDITEGKQSRAAARDTAHNDLATARMRRGAAQEKIDSGIPTEGSDQKVAVLPEPREPLPGDKPGSQWSVKRRTDLVGNAKRGQPGATDVIKNQRPVVLEPRGGTGYGGARTWDPNASPEPPEAGPTVSNSKLIVPTSTKPGLTNPSGNGLPHIDDLEEAFRSKGMKGVDAHRIAQETLDEASGATTVPQTVKQQALERIERIMGPEKRGPVRLGPEARGIK